MVAGIAASGKAVVITAFSMAVAAPCVQAQAEVGRAVRYDLACDPVQSGREAIWPGAATAAAQGPMTARCADIVGVWKVAAPAFVGDGLTHGSGFASGGGIVRQVSTAPALGDFGMKPPAFERAGVVLARDAALRLRAGGAGQALVIDGSSTGRKAAAIADTHLAEVRREPGAVNQGASVRATAATSPAGALPMVQPGQMSATENYLMLLAGIGLIGLIIGRRSTG